MAHGCPGEATTAKPRTGDTATTAAFEADCWSSAGTRRGSSGRSGSSAAGLSDTKVDVAAIQEAQLAGKALSVPGYQTAVVSRRVRGRRGVGSVRGGDVAILVKNGLKFTVIRDSPLQPQDDTTECCAVRLILSTASQSLDVYNVYRPPIRSSPVDERVDLFSLDAFPATDTTLITGDINGHHPDWDVSCLNPDRVGALVHEWSTRQGWSVLNSGAATRAGYGEGARLSTPDVTLAHRDLARRCSWAVGTDVGDFGDPQTTLAGSLVNT